MSTSLKTRLEKHLRAPGYHPQSKSELARALDVPTNERAQLRQILRELEEAGSIVSGQHGRYQWHRAQKTALKGTVYLKPGGAAILAVDYRDQENAEAAKAMGLGEGARIAMDPENLGTAMHGDAVLAQVAPDKPQAWWRQVPEKRRILEQIKAGEPMPLTAKVAQIIERKNTTIVGTLRRKDRSIWVVPDDALLPPKIEIRNGPEAEALAKAGEKVVVTITDWPTHHKGPRGNLVSRLGRPGDPGVDMLGIIHKFHLPKQFPDAVNLEAESIPTIVSEDMLTDREDWRQREVITIDPFDARDFDDAIAVTPLPNGGWELAVHIADVSHYVTPGSALDGEARERGNSTYLADRVIPMLPERLSNGVCSLRPDEDRLTRAAIMTFDAKGNRTATRFIKSVIRSQKRYSYEQAYEVMKPYLANPDAAMRDPAAPLPARAWALAAKLRKLRFANGSLDLDFPEIKVVLDDKGEPIKLAKITHDESHQLIEEFMLQANEAVAEQMRQAGRPTVFRIHEDPDPEKLNDLREFLMSNGIRVGDLTQRKELQKALNLIDQRPESAVLKLAVLKSLKRAAYHIDPLGHYGLAKDNYLHFTSPIRRYADLIVHRVQANLLWGAKYPTPSYGKLLEIAEHLGHTERNSAEAEMQSRKIKEMAFFGKIIKAGKPQRFEAAVTQVRRIGLFIELSDVMTRGIVRAEDFGPHQFTFDGRLEQYQCKNPRRVIKVGDTIQVVPVYVEQDRGTVAFRLA